MASCHTIFILNKYFLRHHISTLLAHRMILGRGATTNASNSVLVAHTTEGCTNPNYKAKKHSIHTMSNCFWPGGGKEGQFPPNLGQQVKANSTMSTTTITNPSTYVSMSSTTTKPSNHFILSAKTLTTPGQSAILIEGPSNDYPHMAFISKGSQNFGKGKIPTFPDSGASNIMFVWKEAFIAYKLVDMRIGDFAKAKDGNFDIIGEGNVIQRYIIDRKENKFTYICAFHTPMLNANLVFISTLDMQALQPLLAMGEE